MLSPGPNALCIIIIILLRVFPTSVHILSVLFSGQTEQQSYSFEGFSHQR